MTASPLIIAMERRRDRLETSLFDINERLLWIARAEAFAAGAHGAINQKRKYTGDPYVEHAIAVAAIILEFAPNDVEMICAALLHDVAEDTAVSLETIRWQFGPDIGELVDWLTDRSTKADGNRAARKAKDRERWRGAPARAQTIKVADLIDNTSSIVERDPEFAKVYLAEKAALLDVLTMADERLVGRARRQIENYKRRAASISMAESLRLTAAVG